MKQEYDFSNAVRGKFFREGAELQLPICSDRDSGTHQRPNLFDYATSELSWCEIESALQEEIPDLPPKSEETIKGLKDPCLYYSFNSGAASLGIVQEEGSIFFGVYYHENQDEHRELEAALNAVLRNVPGSDKPTNGWLWWMWADGNLEEEEYAGRIAQGLKPVWTAIKRAGLA